MVEHVRVWNQCRCPVAIDLQPKISRTHAHSRPLEFLQRANLCQGRDLTNGIIVFGDRFVAIFNLLQQVTPHQTIELLWRPENWHVAEGLWQYFIIGMKKRIGPVDFPVPQEINHQKDVFRCIEIEVAPQNGLPDGRLLSHFDGDQTFPWDGHANSVGCQMGSRVDASHLRIALVVRNVSSLLEAIVVVYWHLLFLFFFGIVDFSGLVTAHTRRLIVFSELELNNFSITKSDTTVVSSQSSRPSLFRLTNT